MIARTLSVAVLASALVAGGAAFAQGVSVSVLLKQKYEIVGVIQSSAGPGIFLKKGDDLMLCFVAETVGSADVATKYCKPVR